MDASRLALQALAFVLTYAIHSTLLLGLACLLAGRVRSIAMRERVWKVALLGGLVTALVQVGARCETPFAHGTLRPQVEAPIEARAEQPPAPAAPAVEAPRARERSAATDPVPARELLRELAAR